MMKIQYKKQILLTITENYINKVKNFIKNIVAFNRDHINFYIVYSFDQDEGSLKNEFSDILKYNNLELHFFKIDNRYLEYKEYPTEFSNSQNLRLILPKLPIKGRCLYLDVDILCCSNFNELYSMDLKGYSIAAVPDSFVMYKNSLSNGAYFNKKMPPEISRKSFDGESSFYFNSGVLLIDVDKIKEEGSWIYNLYQLKNFKTFQDQSYLNLLHYNKTLRLPSKYNYLYYHLNNGRYYFNKNQWNKYPNQNNIEDYKKTYPTFLHFAGHKKQWHKNSYEFNIIWEKFNIDILDIVEKPQNYYEEMIRSCFEVFDYKSILLEQFDKSFLNLNRKDIIKIKKQSPWSFNPILLNTKMFNPNTISSKISEIFLTYKRERFNKRLYINKVKDFKF